MLQVWTRLKYTNWAKKMPFWFGNNWLRYINYGGAKLIDQHNKKIHLINTEWIQFLCWVESRHRGLAAKNTCQS